MIISVNVVQPLHFGIGISEKKRGGDSQQVYQTAQHHIAPDEKSLCNGSFKQSEYNFNEPEKQTGRMHMQLFVEIMLAWLRSGPLPVYETGQINQPKEKILSFQL